MPNWTARFGLNLHPIAVKCTMDLFQKLRRKHKKPKDIKDSSLTPTASAVPSLIQASTRILASQAVGQDADSENHELARAETQTTQSANDERPTAPTGSTRGSKRDRWLARAALILDLTKSAADAAGLAPLKGACEAMVTLLGSIQVYFT